MRKSSRIAYVTKTESRDPKRYRRTPSYQSAEVSKFINVLMLDGKKSVSEAIFYDAMRKIEERTGQPALNVFRQAVSKRSAGTGGAQPPGGWRDLPGADRSHDTDGEALARRWLVQFARGRTEEDDGGQVGWRAAGCQSRRGRRCRSRRSEDVAPDGGSQQGVRSLPLVERLGGDGVRPRNKLANEQTMGRDRRLRGARSGSR